MPKKKGSKRKKSSDDSEDDDDEEDDHHSTMYDEVDISNDVEDHVTMNERARMKWKAILSPEEFKRRVDQLETERIEAKQAFESDRDYVLGHLPDSVKEMFGQVGFYKFGKTYYGALVLNPYHAPYGPGAVRDQWLEMFEKVNTDIEGAREKRVIV